MMSGLLPYDSDFLSSLNFSFSFHDRSVACLSTAKDLPFEIWLHIASFLPADQLQRLCTVNRMLYGVAMSEKYKVIDFCKDTRMVAGILASFNSTSNAQHVRTLHLYPDVLAEYLSRIPIPVRKPKTMIRLSARLYKHTSVLSTNHRSREAIVAQMLQLVDSMSRVTDFRIATRGDSPHSEFREQIVNAGWTAFGSTLRSLTLTVPLREPHFPLKPTLVFPTLQHLAIELSCRRFHVGDTKIVHELLIPFVNNHHSTLRSLVLSLQMDSHADVFSRWSGICHLPYLTNFSFSCDLLSEVPDTALWHILSTHSDQLTEMSLSFTVSRPVITNAENWYKQPFLHVALPRLESFHVSLDCFSDPVRTAAYLGQFKNSLTTLKLTGRRLTHHEVQLIANVFEGRNRLRTLHLEVDYLGSALFDLLSRKFPHLDGLHLVFIWVNCGFNETTGRQSYSEWRLCHFTARPHLHVRPDILAGWQIIVGAALPHLHTLRVALSA